jgi:hypothetical protein
MQAGRRIRTALLNRCDRIQAVVDAQGISLWLCVSVATAVVIFVPSWFAVSGVYGA